MPDKLVRSRSGKTWVILPEGLQDWQHPADLVEQFNGIRQEELDELDDFLMGYYARQESILAAAERKLRDLFRNSFLGRAIWGAVPGSRHNRNITPRDKLRDIRAQTSRKVDEWQKITERQLLRALATDEHLVGGLAEGQVDPLMRAINSMTRKHFTALAKEFEGTDFWDEREKIRANPNIKGIEDFTYGRYSNVLAFIQRSTRQAREQFWSYSAQNTTKIDAERWIWGLRTNANTFKLSETAHGLGLYRYATREIFPPDKYHYRLDCLPSRMNGLSPMGAVAGGLHRILKASEWEQYNRAVQKGKSAPSTGVFELGFHHNDPSLITPIPNEPVELLETFLEDAAIQRSRFLKWLKKKTKKTGK